MVNLLKRLLAEEEGQGTTEYALALGAVTIGIIFIILVFSEQVQTIWSNKTNGLGAKVYTAITSGH